MKYLVLAILAATLPQLTLADKRDTVAQEFDESRLKTISLSIELTRCLGELSQSREWSPKRSAKAAKCEDLAKKFSAATSELKRLKAIAGDSLKTHEQSQIQDAKTEINSIAKAQAACRADYSDAAKEEKDCRKRLEDFAEKGPSVLNASDPRLLQLGAFMDECPAKSQWVSEIGAGCEALTAKLTAARSELFTLEGQKGKAGDKSSLACNLVNAETVQCGDEYFYKRQNASAIQEMNAALKRSPRSAEEPVPPADKENAVPAK